MTYAALETGSGAPAELYRFAAGTTIDTYTSADRPIVYQSETYRPIAISRDQPAQQENSFARELTVTVPRDNPLAARHVIVPPDRRATLTIFRMHRNDPDGEVTVFWAGRVRAVAWRGAQATLQCQSIEAVLAREGLRYQYQATCNHMLYSAQCGVTADNFRTALTVAAIDGTALTAQTGQLATQPDGYYTSGYARRGFEEFRFVTAHTGDNLTLLLPFEGLAVGDALDVFAGCDRTRADCKDKFANLVNFGGFPFVPGRNPFAEGLE